MENNKQVTVKEAREILARDGKPISRERVHQIAARLGWAYEIKPGYGRPKAYNLSDVLAYLETRQDGNAGRPKKVTR